MILKMTRKKQKNNKSGTTGVSYSIDTNRWKACIMKNTIYKYKYFDNQVDAIEWRKRQEEYYKLYNKLF